MHTHDNIKYIAGFVYRSGQSKCILGELKAVSLEFRFVYRFEHGYFEWIGHSNVSESCGAIVISLRKFGCSKIFFRFLFYSWFCKSR